MEIDSVQCVCVCFMRHVAYPDTKQAQFNLCSYFDCTLILSILRRKLELERLLPRFYKISLTDIECIRTQCSYIFGHPSPNCHSLLYISHYPNVFRARILHKTQFFC